MKEIFSEKEIVELTLFTCLFNAWNRLQEGFHNPVEPALLENALLAGPDMRNFDDACTALQAAGALTRIARADDLAATLQPLMTDTARQRQQAAAALATAGALNPLELSDLRASADKVRAVTEASGGGIVWIADGMPEFRRTRPGRDSAGRGWIGLVANESFVVFGLAQVALLPDFLVLVLVLGGLMSAWYREGR